MPIIGIDHVLLAMPSWNGSSRAPEAFGACLC